MTSRAAAPSSADMLYSFLAPATGEPGARLDDARRSTEAKAREIGTLRQRLLHDLRAPLVDAARAMARAFTAGGRLFAVGNGGSATDAAAVASIFLRSRRGRALPAIALSADVATVTALATDVGFDVVYARQIAAHGAPGDIVVGLSTSGNSENVLRAFAEARTRRMLTIGFAGYDGGRMAQAGTIDHLFVVPSASVHRIQEAQTTLYHVLWELTHAALRGENCDE
jgi:D-sedoheptulose 7-phosphate isomerase